MTFAAPSSARSTNLRTNLVAAAAHLIRIPRVNPCHPGQGYEELVGGETAANMALETLYRQAGSRHNGPKRLPDARTWWAFSPAAIPRGDVTNAAEVYALAAIDWCGWA